MLHELVFHDLRAECRCFLADWRASGMLESKTTCRGWRWELSMCEQSAFWVLEGVLFGERSEAHKDFSFNEQILSSPDPETIFRVALSLGASFCHGCSLFLQEYYGHDDLNIKFEGPLSLTSMRPAERRSEFNHCRKDQINQSRLVF